MIRDNYPQQLTMVDKTQHLRERFYRGLRLEIHQRLTPSYETKETSYVTLLRRARQLEEEYSPKHGATARGARDDPQMKNVIQTLKEIKNQIQQHEDPSPQQKKKWKGKFGCYNCGVPEHWNKICPEKKDMKRTALPDDQQGVHHPNQRLRRWDPLVAMGRPNLLLPPKEVEGRDLSCLPSLSTTIQIQLLDFLEELMKHQWKSMALPLPV